jgi:hypothetical protein
MAVLRFKALPANEYLTKLGGPGLSVHFSQCAFVETSSTLTGQALGLLGIAAAIVQAECHVIVLVLHGFSRYDKIAG